MLKPIEYYSTHKFDFKKDKKRYLNEGYQLQKEFYDDLLADYGVANHPKAARAFELAWQYGHASGYQEVVNYFSELVELLQD